MFDGDISERFTAVRELQSGTSSEIHLGRRRNDSGSSSSQQQVVAIKVRKRDTASKGGWPPREASILRQLACDDEKRCHPNLIRFYGSGFVGEMGVESSSSSAVGEMGVESSSSSASHKSDRKGGLGVDLVGENSDLNSTSASTASACSFGSIGSRNGGNSPSISRHSYSSTTSTNDYWIVQEFATHGDLSDIVRSAKSWSDTNEVGSEAEVAGIFREILAGLSAMHEKKIAHLNLALETVLVCNAKEDGSMTAKLGSFHRAIDFVPGIKSVLNGGRRPMRLAYAPPEMLRSRVPMAKISYTAPLADVYSAGIILFFLLTGNEPYNRPRDTDRRFALVSAGECGLRQLLQQYNVRHLSGASIALIASMLSSEEYRLSLPEVISHEFFTAPYASQHRRRDGRLDTLDGDDNSTLDARLLDKLYVDHNDNKTLKEKKQFRKKRQLQEILRRLKYSPGRIEHLPLPGETPLPRRLTKDELDEDNEEKETSFLDAAGDCIRSIRAHRALSRDIKGISKFLHESIVRKAWGDRFEQEYLSKAEKVEKRWQQLKHACLAAQKLTKFPLVTLHAGALQFLDLSCNNLRRVPSSIRLLQSLQTLRLGNNRLRDIPSSIGTLIALETLNLECNMLTALPPEIGLLRSMRCLVLRRNMILSLPAMIGQLQALETLHLGCNQLKHLPPEIGDLQSLKHLLLPRNDILQLPLIELRNLQRLEIFDISDNRSSNSTDPSVVILTKTSGTNDAVATLKDLSKGATRRRGNRFFSPQDARSTKSVARHYSPHSR